MGGDNQCYCYNACHATMDKSCEYTTMNQPDVRPPNRCYRGWWYPWVSQRLHNNNQINLMPGHHCPKLVRGWFGGCHGWFVLAKLYMSLSRHVQIGAKISLLRDMPGRVSYFSPYFAYVRKYHKDKCLVLETFRQFSEVRARQIYYSYVKKVLWDGCKMKGHGTVVGSSPPFSKLRWCTNVTITSILQHLDYFNTSILWVYKMVWYGWIGIHCLQWLLHKLVVES